MSEPFQAIYRDGVLRPLQAVDLSDNEVVLVSAMRPNSHFLCAPAFDKASVQAWLKRLQTRQAVFVERHGVLPDSSTEIAADRMR